jgi:hypothetical protein
MRRRTTGEATAKPAPVASRNVAEHALAFSGLRRPLMRSAASLLLARETVDRRRRNLGRANIEAFYLYITNHYSIFWRATLDIDELYVYAIGP